MNYEIQLFYDPRKIGMKVLQEIYTFFGLEIPSAEELKKPFLVDKEKGVEIASTRFNTTNRQKALSLTDMVLGLPEMRIEISNASYSKRP